MGKTIKVYRNSKGKLWVFGKELSNHAEEEGYLDFQCLADIVGSRIVNNEVINYDTENWYVRQGNLFTEDGEMEVASMFLMISEYGCEMLEELEPNQIVLRNDRLNINLWMITHGGTNWDYVLTDIKWEEET